MAVIHEIAQALWNNDFAALSDPHVIGIVYFVMFTTCFLKTVCFPRPFYPAIVCWFLPVR